MWTLLGPSESSTRYSNTPGIIRVFVRTCLHLPPQCCTFLVTPAWNPQPGPQPHNSLTCSPPVAYTFMNFGTCHHSPDPLISRNSPHPSEVFPLKSALWSPHYATTSLNPTFCPGTCLSLRLLCPCTCCAPCLEDPPSLHWLPNKPSSSTKTQLKHHFFI